MYVDESFTIICNTQTTFLSQTREISGIEAGVTDISLPKLLYNIERSFIRVHLPVNKKLTTEFVEIQRQHCADPKRLVRKISDHLRGFAKLTTDRNGYLKISCTTGVEIDFPHKLRCILGICEGESVKGVVVGDSPVDPMFFLKHVIITANVIASQTEVGGQFLPVIYSGRSDTFIANVNYFPVGVTYLSTLAFQIYDLNLDKVEYGSDPLIIAVNFRHRI